MIVVGTKSLNNSTNIQIGYDLITQETDNNRSLIRAYLVLNVGGTYVTWTRGSAAVQGLNVNIGTYYSRGSYTLVTNEFWVAHDVNGNFSGTLAGGLWTTWLKGDVNGSFTLPQIQRHALITDYDQNPNDEINPTINIFNPANYILNLRLEFDGYAIRRDGIRVSGRYEFVLTEDEKNLIYEHNKETSSCSVRYCVATTYDGTNEVWHSFFDKTFTIVKTSPKFDETYFEIEDINPKTLAITKDKSVYIDGYSQLQIFFKKPMEVFKRAIAKKYSLNIQEIKKEIPFRNEPFKEILEIKKYANDSLKIYLSAIDSRNFNTLNEINLKTIKHEKSKINISAERLNNFENETTIKINGEICSLKVNNEEKNSIKSLKFRFKEIGGSYSEWQDINFVSQDNKFTSIEKKLNLNNEKSFEIEAKIEDVLEEVITTSIVDVGIPAFFISTNKNAVGVNCIPNEDAKVGEIYYKNEDGENKRILDYQKQDEIVQFKDRDELVYPKVKREILMVKKTSKQNLNITFQTILFEEVKINNTDKLSYENGIITIKKGVKRIALTSHLFAESAFNAYLFGLVRKNEENIQEYICDGTQYYKELNISRLPINVQENDKIYIFAQINKADYGQIRSGYLSVEILE